jgi:colicin import membrane protein
MRQPSLQRATAASLIIHLAFLLLVVLMTRKTNTFIMPPPYIVKLVAPEAKPAPKKAKVAPPPVKKAPKKAVKPKAKPKDEGVTLKKAKPAVKKAPEKITAEDEEELKQYIAKRLKAMEARKKVEEYLAKRIRDMEAKKKVEHISKLKQIVSIRGAKVQPAEVKPSVLDDYYRKVQEKIWQEWVFPGTAARDVEAVISITIMKDGRVKVNGFEKSSGNLLFDRSALRAIQKASPLDPPPYEMEIGVRFYPDGE